MGRCRAVAGHEIPERPPIVIEPGEQVEVGERDTEWPEFVFVTTRCGSGWVPARCLSRATGTATAVTRYDTTELRISTGELLDVLERDAASGWTWCRNASGAEGWVPDRTIATL